MGSSRTASLGLIALLAGAGPLHAACAPDRLDLRGPSGVARFHVEVADTGEERSRGLMFREKLASSAGMLFVYDKPESVAFWMKNTLIPLDMIFADATGTVKSVHSGAVPGDLTPIRGGDGIQFVLEINGGMAKRLGITAGTVIRHPAIPPATAAWPCE